MCDRHIDNADVVLRESAIENVRQIASKFDELRMRIIEHDQQDAHQVIYGTATEADYHRWSANRWEHLGKVASQLLHGLSYLLEGAKGGSVSGEDKTSLIGSGWLTVGLVDHGDQWQAHS